MDTKYKIPTMMQAAIRRLLLLYKTSGEQLLEEILKAGTIFIREGEDYDNWNGGSFGHQIVIFLPEYLMQNFPSFDNQETLETKIREDINRYFSSQSNEFISSVSFDLSDETNTEFQEAKNYLSNIYINPDSVDIWEKGFIRVFISHRDEHKKEANELSNALKEYGISAFVAHDTIKPMEEWQKTIIKGLNTMEIMISFISDNFFSSVWTNQEVGVAIGRGIPIISLKLETIDPEGFIGSTQALKGSLEEPAKCATDIYDLICIKLNKEERIRKAIVKAFVMSEDFGQTANRFKKLQELKLLDDDDIQSIINGFNNNDNLNEAYYLTNKYDRLCVYLENRTGIKYIITNNKIAIDPNQNLTEEDEEDLPF